MVVGEGMETRVSIFLLLLFLLWGEIRAYLYTNGKDPVKRKTIYYAGEKGTSC